MRLTIVGGYFFDVAIALGGLSLIEQWHDQIQIVLLQPLLEGHAQCLCKRMLPSAPSVRFHAFGLLSWNG